MNFFDLAYTTPDVLEAIEKAEKEGTFNEHLDPIDYNNSLPVTDEFEYIPKGTLKLRYGLINTFVLIPFTFMVNKFIFKTEVRGRENLKDLNGAIVVCNHVNKYDALAVRYAIKDNHLKIMVGDFNNQKGALGEFMRAYGIMPFAPKISLIKKFSAAVSELLKNGKNILFFPERAEWWCYEKPRPMLEGAFRYAVTDDKPVLPVFITFTKTGKIKKKFGVEKRKFTVNILPPIYPDKSLSKKEQAEDLRQKSQKAWDECYKDFYKK